VGNQDGGDTPADIAMMMTTTPPASDATPVTTPVATDAAVDTSVEPPPIDCNAIGAPAGLATVNGTFAPTGSALPSLAGGDENGEWTLSAVRVHIPGSVAPLVDTNASTIAASGWVSTKNGQFRVSMSTRLHLVVLGAFPIDVDVSPTAGGAYTVAGSELTFTLECSQGIESAIAGIDVAFGNRVRFGVNGNTGTFLFSITVAGNESTLEATMQRIAS
jgi:hypothetical protein